MWKRIQAMGLEGKELNGSEVGHYAFSAFTSPRQSSWRLIQFALRGRRSWSGRRNWEESVNQTKRPIKSEIGRAAFKRFFRSSTASAERSIRPWRLAELGRAVSDATYCSFKESARNSGVSLKRRECLLWFHQRGLSFPHSPSMY